ncbi:hypothetical protein AB4144_54340, partial [Rhizobiaceae sp. 2RAB30]
PAKVRSGLRPELRNNKDLGHSRDSEKTGIALSSSLKPSIGSHAGQGAALSGAADGKAVRRRTILAQEFPK